MAHASGVTPVEGAYWEFIFPKMAIREYQGVDANLLPWAEQWDSNKTLIDGEYVVSPKMFSGTKSTEGKLTGIAQGRDCITIDGVKRTGIFALVDDEVVFDLTQ